MVRQDIDVARMRIRVKQPVFKDLFQKAVCAVFGELFQIITGLFQFREM